MQCGARVCWLCENALLCCNFYFFSSTTIAYVVPQPPVGPLHFLLESFLAPVGGRFWSSCGAVIGSRAFLLWCCWLVGSRSLLTTPSLFLFFFLSFFVLFPSLPSLPSVVFHRISLTDPSSAQSASDVDIVARAGTYQP